MASLNPTLQDLNKQSKLIDQYKSNPYKAPNRIKDFWFGDHIIRSIIILGRTWFFSKDVMAILGYKLSSHHTLGEFVEDTDVISLKRRAFANTALADIWTHTSDHMPKKFVNEYGLNDLIIHSHAKNAKKFQRWVTHEVLPSIAHTGSYHLKPKAKSHSLLQTSVKLAKHTLALAGVIKRQNKKIDQMSTSVDHEKTLLSVPNSDLSFKEFDAYLQEHELFPYGMEILFRFSRNIGFLGKAGTFHNLPNQNYQSCFHVRRCTKNGYGKNVTLINVRGQRMYIEVLKRLSRNILDQLCQK